MYPRATQSFARPRPAFDQFLLPRTRTLLRRTRPPFTRCRLYRTKNVDSPSSITNPKPKFAPSLITPGSDHHNSLPTFIAYAKRTNLSQSSTVYVGTHYEYLVQSALTRLNFTLTRTGSGNDHGIDLLGHWHVPSLPASAPMRVLLQCKARSAPLGPSHVRELEGAFAGAPAGWRGEGVLGLLVANREATRGMREALGRSGLPLGYVMVTSGEGRVVQFVWNQEAARRGLEGIGVTNRYLGDTGSGRGNGDGVEREIVLTWNGWTLKRMEEEEDGRPRKNLVTAVAATAMERGEATETAVEGVVEKRARGRPATKTAASGRKKKR